MYNKQFSNVNTRIDHLEKEIESVWERIKSGYYIKVKWSIFAAVFTFLLFRLPAGGGATAESNNETIQELYNKLTNLQDDMNGLSETARKLVSDREGRQNSLDVLLALTTLFPTNQLKKKHLTGDD